MIYTWHKVENTTVAQLAERSLKEVQVGEKKVGLLLRDGQLYAFAALCPHASGVLCDGWVDARGHIVCPVHKYRFDPANGRNTSGEGYKLRTYPVEVKDGEIYIGLLS